MGEKILVTGAAGFIGFHLCRFLLERNYEVIGLDNINDYYSPRLKYGRLEELGIPKEIAKVENELCQSVLYENFQFIRLNLEDRVLLPRVFEKFRFRKVINLAAQAGVRYSLENPEAYIDSNVVGFLNLLECCKNFHVGELIYASSSSVYGQNKKVPFTVEDKVDHPISLYAATKKANELMAHSYSHLHGIRTIGLRFFTVYGPWGRPDMAMFLFTKAIVNDETIKVFNHGNLERDFTYIDDIVEGIFRIIEDKTTNSKKDKYLLYNIGNSQPVKLMAFIEEIEKALGKKAKKDMLPMQPGDVNRTWADVDTLKRDFDYNPHTPINKGVTEFVKWYKNYHHIE